MRIVVNGEEREVDAEVTVADVVQDLRGGRDGSGVAVAVNGEVVRRAAWPSRTVEEGDAVEIVAAVQGGAR